MKKGIAVVSAFAMAAVMCAGFAACGSDSDAESIVSDEVTQEEWEAAFAEENFTNCKLVFHFTYGGEDHTTGESAIGHTVDTTYIQDGEKLYYKTKSVFEGETEEHEIYCVEGKSYTVTEDGVSVEEGKALTSIYRVVKSDLYVKDAYEDFEYSKEAKGYVYKQDVSDKSDKSKESKIYKFKNGKLAAVIFSYTDTFKEVTEIVTYKWVFTYGGQTVTLPEV